MSPQRSSGRRLGLGSLIPGAPVFEADFPPGRDGRPGRNFRWTSVFHRGRSSCLRSSTALSRQVLFDSFEPRQLLSADVLPVVGSISAPGEVDRYIVALAEPRRFYVDQQLLSPRITCSLRERGHADNPANPSNALASSSLDARVDFGLGGSFYEGVIPLSGGDQFFVGRAETTAGARIDPASSQPSVITLAAGEYELRVEGVGDATGDYRFRLIDIDTAPTLRMDEPVRVSFPTGGETELFRFTVAEPGSLLSVHLDGAWAGADTPKLSFLSPHGTILEGTLGRLFERSGLLPAGALTTPGTYFVAVDGGLKTPAGTERSFTLRQGPAGEALTLDQVVSLGLAGGQSHRFLLPASPEAPMVLDLLDRSEGLRRSGEFEWSLQNGEGATILSGRRDGSTPFVVFPASAEVRRLVIRPAFSGDGTARFVLRTGQTLVERGERLLVNLLDAEAAQSVLPTDSGSRAGEGGSQALAPNSGGLSYDGEDIWARGEPEFAISGWVRPSGDFRLVSRPVEIAGESGRISARAEVGVNVWRSSHGSESPSGKKLSRLNRL